MDDQRLQNSNRIHHDTRYGASAHSTTMLERRHFDVEMIKGKILKDVKNGKCTTLVLEEAATYCFVDNVTNRPVQAYHRIRYSVSDSCILVFQSLYLNLQQPSLSAHFQICVRKAHVKTYCSIWPIRISVLQMCYFFFCLVKKWIFCLFICSHQFLLYKINYTKY